MCLLPFTPKIKFGGCCPPFWCKISTAPPWPSPGAAENKEGCFSKIRRTDILRVFWNCKDAVSNRRPIFRAISLLGTQSHIRGKTHDRPKTPQNVVNFRSYPRHCRRRLSVCVRPSCFPSPFPPHSALRERRMRGGRNRQKNPRDCWKAPGG